MKKLSPIPLIAAQTHSKEYLLHKYWSRKPSNIVAQFLGAFANDRKVVIDPFCGSGVVMLEAKRLGLTGYGFDVNPIASLISRVTSSPPSLDDFMETITPIMADFEALCERAYGAKSGKAQVKYNVHEIVISCLNCSKEIAFGNSDRDNKLYKCPVCSSRLHFNLESLLRTRIIETVLSSGKSMGASVHRLEEDKSASSYYPKSSSFDFSFAENRRILAFQGMTTKMLFSTRNFSLLAWFSDRCREIKSKPLREGAHLLLTASVAQCSRLIPYRNKMTTGGPAWSVPGFWVPPVHLETNPAVHLAARYRKFIQGFSALHRNNGKGSVTVQRKDCSEGVSWLRKRSIKADIIFFDPPYGDSVPFLEFSQLWNSFLKQMPNLKHDLSVSDRMSQCEAWQQYEVRIATYISELSQILNNDGLVIVTFNNSDDRAWAALLAGFQKSNLRCSHVTYQIPAVISSKAQFSVDGSYVSDIYSVWQKNPAPMNFNTTILPVVESLERCAVSRGGMVSRSLANRAFMVSVLETNRSYMCLSQRNSIMKSLFDIEGNKLRWKKTLQNSVPVFRDVAASEAIKLLKKGPATWFKLYEAIAQEALSVRIGIPDPQEVREVLKEIVLMGKDRCHLLTEVTQNEQLSIFS